MSYQKIIENAYFEKLEVTLDKYDKNFLKQYGKRCWVFF